VLTIREALDEQGRTAAKKVTSTGRPLSYLVQAAFAGAYIGVAVVLMVSAAGPLALLGSGWTKLVQGLVFGVALTLVFAAGGELATSNMMTLTQGILRRTISVRTGAGTLAFSFAGYGLMKKRLGTSLSAFQSLTSETAALVPVAIAVLCWVGISGEATFAVDSPTHPLLLASAGVVTAAPLLLFGAAARRVPLVTIGLLQFFTPVIQLLCGVLLLGETMGTSRWVGFGIVWVALLVLTFDSIRSVRSRRRLADAAQCATL